MADLKAFVYLDHQKLNSLSSQLFEGLVSRYIQAEVQDTAETEEQKGPVGSGRLMADVLRTIKQRQEDKFLHDYQFNMFEKALVESGRLIELDGRNVRETKALQLVRVNGRAKLSDFREIRTTTEKFNEIGTALSFLTTMEEQKKAVEAIEQGTQDIKDRNQRAKAQVKAINELKSQLKARAQQSGLHMDPEFLKHLKTILDYGPAETFEIQVYAEDAVVTTILNREYLKEDERLFISKYSRLTEAPICLVGIVSQSMAYQSSAEANAAAEGSGNIRSAMHKMIDSLIDVESSFRGKNAAEVFVDPIAIYIGL